MLILQGPGGTDYPDPLDTLGEGLCGCQVTPKGYNLSGYDNPTVNRLIAEATSNPDQQARVHEIEQAVAFANRDVPLVFPWYEYIVTALSKKLVQTTYKNGPWAQEFTPWMAYTFAAQS